MRKISAVKIKGWICAAAAATDLALFFIKLYVAISSNSIGIYVDSLNSLADTLVCAIAFAGFRIALLKPNEKYPFGYGRIEDIVNFLLSAVILITGLAFVYTSLQRLLYPVPIWYLVKYAVLIFATAAVKLIMAICFGKADSKLNSQVLKNLKTDSILDFFVSVCIVISFTLTVKIGYAVDSLTGIAASVIIVISGVRSLISSVSSLLGHSDEKALSEAQSLINELEFGEIIQSIYCHNYGDRRVYNVVINTSRLSASEAEEAINSLQKSFKERLSAELYIRTEETI